MTGRRILDADGHIAEDAVELRRRMPGLHDGPVSEPDLVSGARRGVFPQLDHLHVPQGITPAGSFGFASAATAQGWLDFMDAVGIESTVLYPTLGLGFGRTANLDWAIAAARAYNDWVYERYTSQSHRIRAAALLPLQHPESAVEELERAVAQLGCVAGMLPSNGLPLHLGAEPYWPVYAAAERLGVCISIHGGNHGQMGMDHLNLWWVAHALGHPHGISIALGSLVANGIFDRFPQLRVAFLEAGVAWLFTVVERFSGSYDAFVPDDPRGAYLKLPAGQSVGDYILEKIRAGRIFIGCEGDECMLAAALRLTDDRGFVYSSDFPHEVSAETCRHEIAELLENDALDEAAKQAVLCDNVERLYGSSGEAHSLAASTREGSAR